MRLVEALHELQLHGDVQLSGRWIKLDGERCTVYVVEAAWGTGYYTWCDDPLDRKVEVFRDPVEAIRAGLRRAAKHDQEEAG